MARNTRSRNAERLRLIKSAREFGLSNAEILKEVLRGEYGGNRRRTLVVEWGELLGMDTSAALQTARTAGLIRTSHPPKKKNGGKETPPGKVLETSSE